MSTAMQAAAPGTAVAAPVAASAHASQIPVVFPGTYFARQLLAAEELVIKIIPARKTVIVESGDTLSSIAVRFCGKAADWTGIWAQNRAEVHDPDMIYPGQKLRFTCEELDQLLSAADSETDPVSGQSQAAVTADVSPAGGTGGGTLSFSGLEALWVAAGGPAWAQAAAAAVAECESGGRQYAYNPSGASGYWQILGEVVPGNIYDPMVNAENAVAKFEASGDTWAQWTCQP